MHRIFHHFSVKEANKPFISSQGTRYSKTAVLTFYDANNQVIGNKDFGFADMDLVYQEIEKNRKIVIDDAYVRNFSMTAWRRLNLIGKHEVVKLEDIQAMGAFFDVNTMIDFSYIKVEKGTINFNEAVFRGGELNFQNGQFINTEIHMEYISHDGGGLNWSSCSVKGGKVSFKNAFLSNGLKNFQYTHFEDAPVDFTNCEFNKGDVILVDTLFTGGVSFKVARFLGGRISFQFAVFKDKDITFDRADFGDGDIDFRTTEFNNIRVNFNRSIAGKGNWDFTGTEVHGGKMTFKKANVGSGKLIFNEAICVDNELNFSRAEMQQVSLEFDQATVCDIDFQECFFNRFINLKLNSANKINFSNAVVRDILDLNIRKGSSPAKVLYFTNMSLPGLLYIDWSKNDVENAIKSQQNETSFEEKAGQFLMLKENFSRNGQYDDEDHAYVQYRRAKARSAVYDEKHGTSKKLWSYLGYGFDKVLLDYTGLYATSPKRVFTTMIVAYFLFSMAYLFSIFTGWGDIVVSVGDQYDLAFFSKGFYHSAITMLTIGYGDHFPTGLCRGISAIEGFIGMLLLSYFTVSLVHKILR